MEFEITVLVGIALVVGLVEGIKKLELFDHKYCFLVSLLFGLLEGVFYFADGDVKKGIWIGLGIGLTASGLFSGAKNFLVKDKE